MPNVVSIRFKQAGPVYYFDPAGVEVATGDWVLVETAHGTSLGQVADTPREIPPEEVQEPLKPVVRRASADEIKRFDELKATEPDVLRTCAELVARHELPMKLIQAEHNFDGTHLTVFFSAEGKIDFRALLKEMGSIFKTRVELRQIGARDVAKMLGGVGRCGRPVCCATHLSKFAPISVRMARDQSLPLNPAMISGACGKLLCCLKYEHSQYLDIKKSLPPLGKRVITPQGPAKVLTMNYLKGTATVQLESGATLEFPVTQLSPIKNKPGEGNVKA